MLQRAIQSFILVGFLASSAPAQMTLEQLIGSAVSDPGPKYKDVENAITLFRAGDAGRARAALMAARRKHPQLPPGDVMLAQLLLSTQQTQAAREALERAVVSDTEDPEAYILLGNLAFSAKQWTYAQLSFSYASLALGRYEGLLHRKQDLQGRTHAGMAAVAEVRQDWEAAKKHIDAWIELEKDSANAHARLGKILLQMDDAKAARQALMKARELDEKQPRPELLLAQFYQQTQRRDEAKQQIEKLLGNEDLELGTALAAADWALRSGELELAQRSAAAAQKAEPEAPQVIGVLGVLARLGGDSEKAEELLSAAHLRHPGNFSLTNQLALALADRDDEDARRRSLEYAQLNALRRRDLRGLAARKATVTLAWTLFLNDRQTEAAQQLQGVLKVNGQFDGEGSYYTAKILSDRGDRALAKRLLASVLATTLLFPHRGEAEKLAAELARR